MSEGDYVELTGDDLQAFLEAPPVAECNRCHRKTWDETVIDTEDRMPQPDGNPCGGTLVDARRRWAQQP